MRQTARGGRLPRLCVLPHGAGGKSHGGAPTFVGYLSNDPT